MLKHLAIQLVAATMAWIWWAPLSDPAAFLLCQSLVALIMASWRKMGLLSRIAHAFFMPAAFAFASLQLPSWVFLTGFLLLLGLSRNALFERVPLYLSSKESIVKLAGLLPEKTSLLELGSGSGRMVISLARLRPDIRVTGIENAWLPWLWSWLRWICLGRPANVTLYFGNIWQHDWHAYTAIYAFLSPAPMARVWQKFQQEAATGTLLVSNTFAIDNTEPHDRCLLGGRLQKELLIWRK